MPDADAMDRGAEIKIAAQTAASTPVIDLNAVETESAELDVAVMENWQSFFSAEEFIDLVTTQVTDGTLTSTIRDADDEGHSR